MTNLSHDASLPTIGRDKVSLLGCWTTTHLSEHSWFVQTEYDETQYLQLGFFGGITERLHAHLFHVSSSSFFFCLARCSFRLLPSFRCDALWGTYSDVTLPYGEIARGI